MKIKDNVSNDSKYAQEINCPILVIDHHILESPVTASNMILINNQTSPKYKNKDLSGAGLAYQFCRAMDYYFDKKFADNYIDLAALGVCADMMSGLEIENQFIWRKGFSKINNYFFWSIAQKQSYSITGKKDVSDEDLIEALTPTTVAFYIVPMINAMIRVGSMEEKERMLTAFIDGHKMIPSKKRGAKGTFEEVAIESVRECVNARSNQNSTKEKAILKLEQKIFKNDLLENSILFIRLEDDDIFPSELNGLVAMNLSQRYKKPTIVARLNDEDYIRGSIRGLSNSELISFKDYLSSTGLFEYVQGHDNAAGCSIRNSNLNLLHQIANEELSKYDFGEKYYEVNFTRKATEPDLEDLVYDLTQYKFLWSHQNPEPLIYISNLLINSSEIQVMGKNANTWKVTKNGISYIKFFANDVIDQCNEIEGNDIKIQLVGKASLNEWMGRVTPQIIIDQIEIMSNNILDF